MQNIYFTVGPSQIYPSVKRHMLAALEEDIFSLNHRGEKFEKLYQQIESKLQQLLRIPQDYSIFFLSSGTEAMERIIQNTVKDHSYHIVTGTFGDRFYKTAQEMGKNPTAHVFDPLQGFKASEVEICGECELIAFTHNDTSTGVQIPMEEIYAMAAQNPDALIAIDTVSSMPYVDIEYTKVDCVFFSVQKGFGMPAGLGIAVLSPRAIARAEQLQKEGLSIGSYHSFLTLEKSAAKHQTPDTPNVFGIYLLEKVLTDFLSIGIDKIRSETDEKANLLYEYFATTEKFVPLVEDFKHRSQTTLVVEVKGGSNELLNNLEQQGLIVGPGYGEDRDNHIRIANFPAHSKEDVKRLIENLKI
jgi:phosphoserine aminotransferase